jgi:hypothetical protein
VSGDGCPEDLRIGDLENAAFRMAVEGEPAQAVADKLVSSAKTSGLLEGAGHAAVTEAIAEAFESGVLQRVARSKALDPWLDALTGDRRVMPSACRLALALRAHFLRHGTDALWPSQRMLAAATRCTVRAVAQQIANLIETGYLRLESKGRGRGLRAKYLFIIKS